MFGHIDGVSVGQIFETRKEVAAAGVHAPLMSGIWGAQSGAYSIVLSGGYEDDIDELDYILYTGQGGQDVPGGKQIANQDFTKGNRGLQLSCMHRLPVRVVRGHQIANGPVSGYRYDGIYYVQGVERIKGRRGFYICRFHLVSEVSIDQLESFLKSSLKSTYVRPRRVQTINNRLQRNVKLSEKIKEMYSYRCQVCSVLLDSPSGPIAIGAHIKGLGRPHDGPDIMANMLCLCPNHHDQLDNYSFYVEPDNFEIVGLDQYKGMKLKVLGQHKLDRSFLAYHKKLFFENSR